MYVILGCGTAGYLAASKLQEQKKSLLIIDKDDKRIETLKERNFENVIKGDITDVATLKAANVDKAEAVLILTTDVELNKRAAKAVRTLNEEVPIILRAGKDSTADEFRKLDIDVVVYPTVVVAEEAIKSLKELGLRKKLKLLQKIIKEAPKGVAIVTQDNPDPDAIASALSLKQIVEHLGNKAEIIYGGEIGHEENRALVNLLGITLIPIAKVRDLRDYSKIALIEASIPGENNSLPKNITPDIVIDHHPVDESRVVAVYKDIRPEVGATSTILTEYLTHLNIEITPELATALLYGIKTDTNDFTRGTTSDDLQAVALLYSKADHDLLLKIETPLMSAETLDVLSEAIRNRKIRGSFLLTNVGFIRDRDTLPQAADYLLRLEGISTVLVYGIGGDVIHISGRNKDIRINLGEVMQKAFGNIGSAGGHATAAAAKIPLGLFGGVKDKDSLLKLAEEAITDRFFRAVGLEEK
jgi:nanoRNase/pAp phosphatase (c-di-AMP/oligoRNAs hydrolase)